MIGFHDYLIYLLGDQPLASRGGRQSKDPPPRGVNFLLGGQTPPP